MKIDILTLFPSMFDGFISESIIKRAILNKLLFVNLIDFREYSPLNNKQVDDTPYGGGAGMLLRCEPIFNCLDEVKKPDSYVIMLGPSGKTFNQSMALEMSKKKHLILLCGRYEGFDERIKTLIDEEISIGDYVLTGGEVPAMVLVDTISRLIPGVINKDSLIDESFNNNLLDYPNYTKPSVYRGLAVPVVLINGDHKKIDLYRVNEQIKKTTQLRPDLIGDTYE
ncbi:MAG: tRNA (guanosine(37)-N1)-methyltransferase TrmD [Bacilli bacterium]